MEGEGAVALDEDEEPDGGPQPHDQGPTHCCCVQGGGTCQKRKYANDCQYDNDDAPRSQVPAGLRACLGNALQTGPFR